MRKQSKAVAPKRLEATEKGGGGAQGVIFEGEEDGAAVAVAAGRRLAESVQRERQRLRRKDVYSYFMMPLVRALEAQMGTTAWLRKVQYGPASMLCLVLQPFTPFTTVASFYFCLDLKSVRENGVCEDNTRSQSFILSRAERVPASVLSNPIATLRPEI